MGETDDKCSRYSEEVCVWTREWGVEGLGEKWVLTSLLTGLAFDCVEDCSHVSLGRKRYKWMWVIVWEVGRNTKISLPGGLSVLP